ncbi:hypothetical protein [Mycobacteroides abscessus]|uniref:hypothetical protein n=1 Tax=Mycobacteroides abscessus TaxID=36809 RepID=UPI000928071B|nr:hypothetical protein [Mycobacteroides abscessus]SIL18157.1 Uncharacterised protein [Mycobacteroides abscessus subsp. abscessus]SKR82887.1 Uncharacterised protein [Mycobacteroides abscessus subsp. abscessus]SKR85947.1 Uncharacterised protein [Mycobacteroides abscessus subsp. abscessus]SKR95395.1 Uncharacterised protein [Mycobacteroides abscessus subsp. massiliense]SKT34087.1 Uncharacterised protein [Mycobacteroides abscessus subsp. abscessus]
MANDNWQGRSHGEIVNLLSALKSDAAHEESKRWDNTSTAVADSIDTAMAARTKLLDNAIWDGEAASAAYDSVDKFYKEAASPQTGLAAEAGKISQAALQDGETLIAASRVAQNYPEPGPGAPTNRKKEELEAIRAEAQRMYTDPLSAANRPEITDGNGQQQMGQIPQGGGGGNGGGSGSGSGGGSGTQTPPSSSDGLASKDTKPQLAGGEGQQAGAGQGQGQGSGSGGGQGAGSGSGGSQGSGSGGSGSGLGSGSGGSGLPIGSTTAAGFSPSSTTGTGVGGSGAATGGPGGLSALRGGAGLPGGAAAGAGGGGVNPASVGAAGVRGMGPMGMMGAGAHGGHGKGEDDDDHATPSYLINVDNGNALFGEEIKASPGVIGDWTENEEAEKKAREAEIRRYKSMGWNVKFE